MVWYYFDVTASIVQPISIMVNNIDCNNTGVGNTQVGVFRNVTCPAAGTASSSNGLGGGVGMGCAVGTENVTVTLPDNAPLGRYYVVVDDILRLITVVDMYMQECFFMTRVKCKNSLD